MPPKIRDMIAELTRAGFSDRGGKGSHRNFVHPDLQKPVTVSGQLARTIHEGSSPVTRCAKRQCGAPLQACSRTYQYGEHLEGARTVFACISAAAAEDS